MLPYTSISIMKLYYHPISVYMYQTVITKKRKHFFRSFLYINSKTIIHIIIFVCIYRSELMLHTEIRKRTIFLYIKTYQNVCYTLIQFVRCGLSAIQMRLNVSFNGYNLAIEIMTIEIAD